MGRKIVFQILQSLKAFQAAVGFWSRAERVIFSQENVFFAMNNKMNYLAYKYWRSVKSLLILFLRVTLKDHVLLRHGNKNLTNRRI